MNTASVPEEPTSYTSFGQQIRESGENVYPGEIDHAAHELADNDPPAIERPEGADTLLRVDLGRHGLEGEFEHLWARQVADHRFVLCSVPFFAYGMTSGDEVQVDNDHLISSVTLRSGNLTLRMSTDAEQAVAFRGRISPLLDQLGVQHEWQGDGYVAILLDASGIPGELVDLLGEWPKATRPEWELA